MIEDRRWNNGRFIEFHRRWDGLFNVWQIIDGEWVLVAVCKTHNEAHEKVRGLREAWRAERDRRDMEMAA